MRGSFFLVNIIYTVGEVDDIMRVRKTDTELYQTLSIDCIAKYGQIKQEALLALERILVHLYPEYHLGFIFEHTFAFHTTDVVEWYVVMDSKHSYEIWGSGRQYGRIDNCRKYLYTGEVDLNPQIRHFGRNQNYL